MGLTSLLGLAGRGARVRAGRTRRRRTAPLLNVEALENRCLLSATLVQDINPAPGGSDPKFFTAVGDRKFFAASAPGTGEELYVSDGTAEGTRLVKDINPGPDGSGPFNLRAVGNRLFFNAVSPLETGVGDWVSDGTPEGTMRFQDSLPVAVPERPSFPVAVGGRLYFTIPFVPRGGSQLWVTDGTPAGTTLVHAFSLSAPTLAAVGDRVLVAFSGGARRRPSCGAAMAPRRAPPSSGPSTPFPSSSHLTAPWR
jgi:ELWxxDGT repeat protein